MKKLSAKTILSKISPVIFSLAVTTLTGCYAFFQERIPMDNTKDNGTLGDLLIPETKIKSLEVPAQLYASQGMFPNKILISWKEVKGASSYRLERAIVRPDGNGNYGLPEESDFEGISNYCYSTVYTDVILTNPTNNNEEYNNRYFYRVMAENISAGLESDFTDFTQGPTKAVGHLFKAPSNVEAWKGKSEDQIKITWNPVEGAAYYVIYRGEKENGTNMEQLVQVRGNQTSYMNTILDSEQGMEFYYKVAAQNSDGQLSAFSSLAMGFSLKFGAPSAPQGITVLNPYAYSKTSLSIKWDAAGSPASEYERTYALYRTSSADSVYTLVKNQIPLDQTSYTETSGLKTGVIYYYYMQTVDTNTSTGEVIKSTFSETGPGTPDCAFGFLLSAPSAVDIEDSPENGKVVIKWTPAVGSNIDGVSYTYSIYCAEAQDSSYTVVDGANEITGELGPDGYLSFTVPKYNFYKMSTIKLDSADVESSLTSAVAPVPDAPVNVTASKTKNLSSYGSNWTFNANEVYPVEITWKKPPKDNPAAYNIYRSTKPDSAFKKINDEPIGPDAFKFLDKNDTAKSGNFYYYRVVSLNSLNQGKKGNNPVDDDPENGGNRESWGYGAITREQWFREYNKEIATSQAKLVLMHKSNDLDKVGSETINAFLPVNGATGTLGYKAAVAGLGAEITMPYKNYGDHTIVSNGKLIGISFILNGNTDTTSNMSANGNMHEKVECYHFDDYKLPANFSYTFKDVNNKNGGDKTYTGEIYDYPNKTSYKIGEKGLSLFQGMYPGYAIYNNLQIKGGAAGGGYYLVQTFELDRKSNTTGTTILSEDKVDWLVGEEIRN